MAGLASIVETRRRKSASSASCTASRSTSMRVRNCSNVVTRVPNGGGEKWAARCERPSTRPPGGCRAAPAQHRKLCRRHPQNVTVRCCLVERVHQVANVFFKKHAGRGRLEPDCLHSTAACLRGPAHIYYFTR